MVTKIANNCKTLPTIRRFWMLQQNPSKRILPYLQLVYFSNHHHRSSSCSVHRVETLNKLFPGYRLSFGSPFHPRMDFLSQ